MPLRLIALLLGLLCSLPAFTTIAAQGFAGLAGNQAEFLPVNEAFIPSADWLAEAGQLRVRFSIAEGYYLYRHQLRFRVTQPAGVRLGEARIPAGAVKEDEYFGRVEVYHHSLEALIPLAGVPAGTATLMLELRFQGCAERGLCYPPETLSLPLLPAAAAASAGESAGTAAAADASGTPEQERAARLLGKGNPFWIVAAFFGFGLLLAFTPCVLPMLPILSGILAGAGARISAGRGFALAGAYVLAMALAYTVFGVLAGLTGTNLQAALQAPWVIGLFSAVFVVLALAMFGLYTLQLPAALQSRLAELSRARRGGSLAGAAAMGFIAALIVGPCIAPPLAGALIYIGNTGNALLGGLALFALGLGMGVPLLLLGIAGGGLLPRAGAWMTSIQQLFGFVMLGVALWLLGRILPGPLMLALWALLLLAGAAWLAFRPGHARALRLLSLPLLLGAGLLLLGAARGADDPLAALRAETAPATAQFTPVKGVTGLRQALAEARAAGRPVLLDLYADWCASCVKMERRVFPDPAVRAALAQAVLLRADITANDAEDRALLRRLGLHGPPAVLFHDRQGREQAAYRLLGETDAAGFAAHAGAALRAEDACTVNASC